MVLVPANSVGKLGVAITKAFLDTPCSEISAALFVPAGIFEYEKAPNAIISAPLLLEKGQSHSLTESLLFEVDPPCTLNPPTAYIPQAGVCSGAGGTVPLLFSIFVPWASKEIELLLAPVVGAAWLNPAFK